MDEIVKYDNQLNRIAFSNLTSTDLDLFMLICAKAKNKGDRLLKFSFSELKKSMGLSKKTDKYFLLEIQRVSKKFKHIGGSFSDGMSFDEFTLFPTFHGTLEEEDGLYGHLDKCTMVVRVNPDYAFLLNELTKNFTSFELAEFIKLNSKYSKNLYRLLKQFRRTGTYKVEAGKFRELMGCPASYTNKLFMHDCVTPAVEELSHGYFDNLKVEPIRAAKRGAPIIAYEFTFRKSDQIPGQMHIDDYELEQTETEPEKEKPSKPKPEKKPKGNRFNNFEQREYTQDQYAALEREQIRAILDELDKKSEK